MYLLTSEALLSIVYMLLRIKLAEVYTAAYTVYVCARKSGFHDNRKIPLLILVTMKRHTIE